MTVPEAPEGATPEGTAEPSEAEVADAISAETPSSSSSETPVDTTSDAEQGDGQPTSTPDPMAAFSERLDSFAERLQILDKLEERLNPKQKEEVDYFQQMIDKQISDRLERDRNQEVRVDFERRLGKLQEEFPKDFQDEKVAKSMQRIANGGMTPEELFFASNYRGIIERERRAAIQSYKEEVLRKHKLSQASSNESGNADNGGKSRDEMSFDELMESNYNRLIS